MRILNLEQFKKEPIGTLYSIIRYDNDVEIFADGLIIKTDSNNEHVSDSILPLLPTTIVEYMNKNKEFKSKIKWSYINITADDYIDNTLFAVFDKDEIVNMMKILSYALSNGKVYLGLNDEYDIIKEYKNN